MSKNILKRWYNVNHLRIAEMLNGGEKQNAVKLYFVHMGIGLREAGKQFIMCVLSIVHAIFPWIINFKLLEMVINQTIGLYKFLPQHPDWEKLKKVLNDDNK